MAEGLKRAAVAAKETRIDADVLKSAQEYVLSQLEVMRSYGSCRDLSDVETRELVVQIAEVVMKHRRMNAKAKRARG
jgi:hypothetical protein